MPPECTPLTRSLYAWEIQEARRVFGEKLACEQIRIHECTSWPDTIDKVGRFLKRMPPPIQPNAVTLGNHCYFPVRLLETLPLPSVAEYNKLLWLVHELTHAWQYQHFGWLYLLNALSAQFSQGAQAYDFGGEAGLQQATLQGRCFTDFNPEQQGDICRSYYDRLCREQDTAAWRPFILELQSL